MKTIWSLLLIVLCVTAVAQNDSQPTAHPPIYITHVMVIDTETGREAPDQTVVISGEKILDVLKSASASVPTEAKVVDGSGKFLIPGLWDMHVHRTEYESTYPMYLANGVTGVREMAGPQDAKKFRADLAKKNIDAPRMYLASPIIDGYPPRWPDQIAMRNAEEARAVVDEQKQNSADFIKVYDRLSRESYFAIIDEARRQQIPVVGHVPFGISAWEASAAGQKSIEHVHAIPLACSSREAELRTRLLASPNSWKLWNPIYMEAYQSYDDAKCLRLVSEFRRNGTWLVPTLVVFRSAAFSNDPQFRNDDRLRYFSGDLRNWLRKNFVAERSTFDAADFAIERDLFTRRKALVGALFRAGASLLAGTDTPNPFVFPGFGLHDELVLLVEGGVTPLGALQAATRNPALFLGISDKYGSVTPGKIADLVLLDANPLTDIHNTTKIREVFLDGKEFDRVALDLILKNAEQKAKVSLKLSPAEQEVWAQEETYWRSLKSEDRETYLRLWDERFIGWPRYEGVPAGKDKIRQDYTPGATVRGKLVDYKLEPLSVRSYANDVVITFYRATINRSKPNGEVESRTSRLTHTWMKTDQGWRIIGGMSADDDQHTKLAKSNPDPNRDGNRLGEADDEKIQQVLAVDEARRLAMLHSDTKALDSLLANDATIFWGDGTVDDKASTLELFRSGRLRYKQLHYDNTRVQLYGDIAVVTGTARLQALSSEQALEHTTRVTRVYAHNQGRWRLVFSQTTRVDPVHKSLIKHGEQR
jgi:ketosteroid isomerase-like protein